MNVHVPGQGQVAPFWIILGAMVGILAGMLGYFRRRGWL
jgi:Mg2+ and Co2+ transporter CorA